jgi:hypothetical protein
VAAAPARRHVGLRAGPDPRGAELRASAPDRRASIQRAPDELIARHGIEGAKVHLHDLVVPPPGTGRGAGDEPAAADPHVPEVERILDAEPQLRRTEAASFLGSFEHQGRAIALGLLAESETRLRSELQRYGLKKAPAQDGSYGNQGPAGVDVTALHAVLQRRSLAMVPSPRHASRVDSSASAAPDLTSSRPATYYDCRTRARYYYDCRTRARYFRRQRQNMRTELVRGRPTKRPAPVKSWPTPSSGSIAPVTRNSARAPSPAALTKQQVARRLRAHAAAGQVVTAKWLQDHDPMTYRGALARFGGIASARTHAGVAPRNFAFWSQERLIDELRRIQLRGRVRITNYALRAAGYHGLVSAIYVRIGSLPRARRLAGIPDPGYRSPDAIHRWDEDSVIGEIRARHRRKQSLAPTKVPLTLRDAANRYCGNWQAAIELAGFDYESIRLHRRAWTREELIAKVRAAVKSRARRTDAPSLSKLVVSSHRAFQRLFGGLRGALLAAGIDPASTQKRIPSEWSSNDALIDALRAYVARTPPPTSGQLFRSRLGRQAVFRFGSRDAVIRKIGVGRWSPQRVRPVPAADEVVRWLQARHRAGHHMSRDAANSDAPRLVHACRKRFGSWRAAMQAAGLGELIGGRVQLTSPAEVVRALRERHRHGLSIALKRATGERPRLVRAACAQFGTWQAALDAAGLGEVPVPRALLSPQEVRQGLQARHRRGRPMTAVATQREEGRLVYAACKHFGTWKAAMRAARLDEVVDAARPASGKRLGGTSW